MSEPEDDPMEQTLDPLESRTLDAAREALVLTVLGHPDPSRV